MHIIKRLLIDHKRACGNIFYMTFLLSKVESQSENETDMHYLPITLIYGTPSIVKCMNVFAEQVNKNAIIKGNTRLKIIGFILTTSSFRLLSIPVEYLISHNFNYVICKLEPDGMKGFHSFQKQNEGTEQRALRKGEKRKEQLIFIESDRAMSSAS